MKRGSRTRRNRGGSVVGVGMNGIVYTKPDEIEKKLLPGCVWKDGYVMKAVETEANKEWEQSQILRNENIQGAIYPEYTCALQGGETGLLSPNGGESLLELFYSNEPIRTQGHMDTAWGNLGARNIVRNRDKLPKVIDALKTLLDQIKIMNSKKVFHNDIHEGNIVYDGNTARLIDFEKMTREDDNKDIPQIEMLITNLRGSIRKAGLRKKAVTLKRRTRKRRSSRSK